MGSHQGARPALSRSTVGATTVAIFVRRLTAEFSKRSAQSAEEDCFRSVDTAGSILNSEMQATKKSLHCPDKSEKFTGAKDLRKTRAKNAASEGRGQATPIRGNCQAIQAGLLWRDVARFAHEARPHPGARKLFHYCDDRTVEHHRPAGFGIEFVNIDTGFPQELPPQIGLDRAGVHKDIARFRCSRRTIPRPSRSRGSLDWRTGLILEG
jgi:hypothetical protein